MPRRTARKTRRPSPAPRRQRQRVAVPVTLLGQMVAIEYKHAADGRTYRHDFGGKRRAELYAERGGDALIVSPAKVKGGYIR